MGRYFTPVAGRDYVWPGGIRGQVCGEVVSRAAVQQTMPLTRPQTKAPARFGSTSVPVPGRSAGYRSAGGVTLAEDTLRFYLNYSESICHEVHQRLELCPRFPGHAVFRARHPQRLARRSRFSPGTRAGVAAGSVDAVVAAAAPRHGAVAGG